MPRNSNCCAEIRFSEQSRNPAFCICKAKLRLPGLCFRTIHVYRSKQYLAALGFTPVATFCGCAVWLCGGPGRKLQRRAFLWRAFRLLMSGMWQTERKRSVATVYLCRACVTVGNLEYPDGVIQF